MIKVVGSIGELRILLKAIYGHQKRVLDIGCGIRPFGWLSSDFIVCIEPFDPYRDILESSFGAENLIAFNSDLASVTKVTTPSSFDLITLIDVIEHLPKDQGSAALESIIASGAKRLFVFTPKGFMPQHAESLDAWGFNSGFQQVHLSGWDIEDFKKLGFSSFILVKGLHEENEEKWDGLLAIYDTRSRVSRRVALWDPENSKNQPDPEAGHILVLGRHNRLSGTIVGTHQYIKGRKLYIPSLSFAPSFVQSIYKFLISVGIKIYNKVLGF